MPIKLSNNPIKVVEYLNINKKNLDDIPKKGGFLIYGLYYLSAIFDNDTKYNHAQKELLEKTERYLIEIFENIIIKENYIRYGAVKLATKIKAKKTFKYIFTLNLTETDKEIQEKMKEALRVLGEYDKIDNRQHR